MDLEDRQIAAVSTGLIALLAIPVVILGVLIFVAGWFWTLGIPGAHGILFGWLSTKHYNAAGRPAWGIGRIVPTYLFGVVSTYLGYQVVELLYSGFSAFRRALT